DELATLNLSPYTDGDQVDAVVVQANHPEFSKLGKDDFPGVQVLVDGRNCTDPALWDGVKRFVIGDGEA
ncbi:nucleotide sugar dehydrogenase, partial [Luteococcus sp. H138]